MYNVVFTLTVVFLWVLAGFWLIPIVLNRQGLIDSYPRLTKSQRRLRLTVPLILLVAPVFLIVTNRDNWRGYVLMAPLLALFGGFLAAALWARLVSRSRSRSSTSAHDRGF